MAVQKRMQVRHEDVFPSGAFLVGEVEAVADFNAERRADGSRPQQVDKDTGVLMWSVQVLDADPEARKNDKTVSVKLVAPQQPVPPDHTSGMPFTPVEFTDLTVLPYVDDNGARPRIAWSFRAAGMTAPGKSNRPASSGAGGDSGKAA